MNRVVLALLLALLGCGGDRRAVRALIQLDPQLPASCVLLELSDAEGRSLRTERVVRPVDHATMSVAIFQGDLPRDIQLRAHAMWGSGCDDPLWDNGTSESADARFESAVGEVTLALSLPPPALDADRDGFIAREAGGPDCDDTQVRYQPGVQEQCDASDDFNCDGRRGCDDASCANRSCSRVATALAFSSPEARGMVGECSREPVVVERRDAQGLPTAPNYATPVALSTTLPADAALYGDAACGTRVGAPSIPARASSLSFYVRGTRAARGEVMATSASLSPATLAHTLLPGPTTKLLFAAASSTSVAGECIPVTITRRDRFDNDNTGASQGLSFSPPPSEQGAFYSDPSCGSPVSSTSFPEGVASLPLYFRGVRAGDITLVVSLAGVGDARYARTVLRGPASKLSLTLAPVVLMGSCSAQALVRTSDAFDNPVPPAAAVSATLSAASGLELYSDAACTSALSAALPLTPATPANGFYVKGRTSGQLNVTASSPDLTATTQAQAVAPLVRRDLCTLAPGKKSVECPIVPALIDRGHAFLVFQSTTIADTSESAFVRCRLGSTQSVLCDRVGDQGTATIQWQVVELARGLRVQHLEQACVNNSQKSLTVDVPTAVQPEKAFVLFSSSQAGTMSAANDFATVQLAGNKQVRIDLEDNCYSSSYAVQVVEFDGLAVTRNVTPSTSGASMEVTVPAAEVSHSVLTSTFRVQGNDTTICARMVRGELANATTLRFSRGAGSTACNAAMLPAIAYERLTFPAEVGIQARTLSLDATATTVTDTLTPVDPTRTLLLSSGQVHGGQGAGETSFATNDIPGMAVARLRMTSPTQLELARDASGGVSRWTVYALQFEP